MTHYAFSFRVRPRWPRNTMGATMQANSRSQGGFEGHWLQGWFCTPLHTPLISWLLSLFLLYLLKYCNATKPTAMFPTSVDSWDPLLPDKSCGDLSRVPKVTRMKWNSAKVHTPHLDRARSGRPFRAFTISSWKHYGASWVQMFVDPWTLRLWAGFFSFDDGCHILWNCRAGG